MANVYVKGDLNAFIEQLGEIERAKWWEVDTTPLFLRESLVEEANECRPFHVMSDVLAALLARSKITFREAKCLAGAIEA